jgi:hypothetical protein
MAGFGRFFNRPFSLRLFPRMGCAAIAMDEQASVLIDVFMVALPSAAHVDHELA